MIVKSSGGDAPASYWDESYSQPYFDNTTRRDITVTLGQTALLHCRVRNLGDRAVSFFLVQHFSSHCKKKIKSNNAVAKEKMWSDSALREKFITQQILAASRNICCG